MSFTVLPPQGKADCDKCGRSLNWGSGDYDYMVFDVGEWPGILAEHGWELRGEEVWCEDCLWEKERVSFRVDMSAVPDDATITEATLRIYEEKGEQ